MCGWRRMGLPNRNEEEKRFKNNVVSWMGGILILRPLWFGRIHEMRENYDDEKLNLGQKSFSNNPQMYLSKRTNYNLSRSNSRFHAFLAPDFLASFFCFSVVFHIYKYTNTYTEHRVCYRAVLYTLVSTNQWRCLLFLTNELGLSCVSACNYCIQFI